MWADAMGPLAERSINRLDLAEWERVARDVARAGVGKGLLATGFGAPEPDHFHALLEHVNEALGASPVPASEWPAPARVLGVDLLARLLGFSTVSLRRYLSGARKTPDVDLRPERMARRRSCHHRHCRCDHRAAGR